MQHQRASRNSESSFSEPGLWTVEQCAQYLSCTPKALRHRLRRGEHHPPVTPLGRRVYFRPEDVVSWLARQGSGPSTKEAAERMEPTTRPAPHDKTRLQVDLNYPLPDPRKPSQKLRLQKTAPKGSSEDQAKEWARENADRFLAEFFGKVGVKEENKNANPSPVKPATKPATKRIPKVTEVYLDMLGEVIEGLEPSTQDTWVGIWRRHIEPKWGDRPIDLIDRIAILGWRKELQKKFASNFCNEIVTKLRSILAFAAERGHILGAPRIKKLPEEEAAEKDPYSEEELMKLLGALQGDQKGLVLLLLTLDVGMRRNEVIALRWCDVDFASEEIKIRHTIYKGKLKKPKGKKAVNIPMHPRVQQVLLEAKGTAKLTDHVIPGERNSWTSESAMRNYMMEVASRAGVEWKGFHKGKHTFISSLLDNGATLQELQLLARHKHPTTTERYMHTRKAAAVMRAGIARLIHAEEPKPVNPPLRVVK